MHLFSGYSAGPRGWSGFAGGLSFLGPAEKSDRTNPVCQLDATHPDTSLIPSLPFVVCLPLVCRISERAAFIESMIASGSNRDRSKSDNGTYYSSAAKDGEGDSDEEGRSRTSSNASYFNESNAVPVNSDTAGPKGKLLPAYMRFAGRCALCLGARLNSLTCLHVTCVIAVTVIRIDVKSIECNG